MIYEPFSIVIVPFPFADKEHAKRRPALVLSSALHQKDTSHVTLLMVTSAKHSNWKSDYLIQDLETTGLTTSSIVRQKLFTIDARLLVDHLGRLSTQDEQHVINRLVKHLSFGREIFNNTNG